MHGADELQARPSAAGRALFGRGDLAELAPEATLRAALREAGLTEVAGADGLPAVADASATAGLVGGLGEARRAIKEGGAYVNNERVTDAERR